MKILVFSDSHGRESYLRDALNAHPDADAAVFLGDGAADAADVFASYPALPHRILAGNCDSRLALSAAGIPAEAEALLNFGGLRFWALHGHTEHVKSGYDRLIARASEMKADAVLFGHTHIPENSFVQDALTPARRILLFNPGSIGLSFSHSYGVIHVVNAQISAAHGYLYPKR